MIACWAADRGLSDASYEDLVKSQEVHDLVDEYVQKLNAELNRWETIKKWALLDHDLSVERGELTPSLKVKRGGRGAQQGDHRRLLRLTAPTAIPHQLVVDRCPGLCCLVSVR